MSRRGVRALRIVAAAAALLPAASGADFSRLGTALARMRARRWSPSRSSQARAFDTSGTVEPGDRFVVDAERGLILTNRHVVTPGPVVATAVFQNREESSLRAVYRDPVHDFGLYRYDPPGCANIRPAALPLYPEGARVGTDIRVVRQRRGRAAVDPRGTLARLDRETPDYGVGKYNDFNTFYIQAASGTSGGSSGSPVIDIRGRVVALNAGGSTGAASSFYLPLGRVAAGAGLLREGQPVHARTLQVVFAYTPYDELVRLGLRSATEARGAPRGAGADRHARGEAGAAGFADGGRRCCRGDILVRVNGQLVTTFDPLAECSTARSAAASWSRWSAAASAFERQLEVQDLHAITPAEYVEFGDAVVHTLSYQMARHFNAPCAACSSRTRATALGAAGVRAGR